MWLLYIPWHFPLQNDPNIKGASLIAERAFQQQYPAIYGHLLGFKEQLSNRNKAETGIRYEWYALQRWGANYWEEFNRQKIIYKEIVQSSCFVLDEDLHYFCLDTCRIITGENVDLIIHIFNSTLFFYAVKIFYGGGGLGDKGIRMKHTFFEKFPMINDIKVLNNIANSSSIDEAVFEAYQMTSDEIKIIKICSST